jgi:hypothetical protein
MSKRITPGKRNPIRNEQPYVQVAAFCEHIMEAKSGVWSAIGMFDQLTMTEEIPPPPQPGMKPVVQLKLLLAFKSGSVKGERKIKVVPRSPSGKIGSAAEASGVFNGGEHGVTVQVFISLELAGEGLYWFDVLIDGAIVTRMPLRILYHRPVDETEESASPE